MDPLSPLNYSFFLVVWYGSIYYKSNLFDFIECSKNPEKHCPLSEFHDVIYLIRQDKNGSYHLLIQKQNWLIWSMIHQYLLPSHYVPIVDSEAIETGKLRVVTQPYESVRIVMYVIHLILESIFDSFFFSFFKWLSATSWAHFFLQRCWQMENGRSSDQGWHSLLL